MNSTSIPVSSTPTSIEIISIVDKVPAADLHLNCAGYLALGISIPVLLFALFWCISWLRRCGQCSWRVPVRGGVAVPSSARTAQLVNISSQQQEPHFKHEEQRSLLPSY